ncbi:acetyl-CoA carboxylase biotin carboxyl carrier protein [Solirubrum puertoriconensis]|uniref:Biotin carboxyl carrier protein of acetyl-CoA carboxylase n=1 Tax=Solirubrum puertoriconensis TaxID=1751427 RepID=A0A9X0HKC7_SOLP1|nr:acetyl-CoA carboxylase biotin carboxyl carrier protein [Solirubrum puertoriconensis]KUG07520.1 acetyl-CoA carboxylase biotin carboxyl carrier protein subunit [Solirubrum puertoriconensis]
MKAKELQELIDFIAKSGLNKVNIETEEFKISVQREPNTKVLSVGAAAPAQHAPAPVAAPAPQATPAAAPAPQAATSAAAPAEAPAASNTVALKAPMIGTFYRSSSPENPPFVGVGDVVEQGQVICIIEAMKLFNEIEAEQRGRIVKVMVDNSSPVEYDQPLFLIEPM